MIVKLLTEHHLEFLGLKGGFTGSYESTLVKMSHCWKSHATAHYRLSPLWASFGVISAAGGLAGLVEKAVFVLAGWAFRTRTA